MKPVRYALAWVLYWLGDAVSVVFDKWLPWGMIGPIYRTYSNLMLWSCEVQGDGRGPWSDATDTVTVTVEDGQP